MARRPSRAPTRRARALQRVVDDAALSVDEQCRPVRRGLDAGDPDPEIVQPQGVVQSAVAIGDARQQHRVDHPLDAEVALQPVERREDGAHFRLLRLERELAEPLARQHARDLQAERPADIFLAAVERLDGDLCRFLNAGQQGFAGSGRELGGERRRKVDAVSIGQAVKRPEALVHAVDQHVGGATPRRFVNDSAGRDDEWRRGAARRRGAQRIGDILAKEGGGADQRVGAAQPPQRDVAQAAAHRVADDERASQHGGRRRNAEHDGEIGTPVKRQAAQDQRAQGHSSVPPFIS